MQTSMHARLAPCLCRRRRRFKIWRTTPSLIFTLRTQNCLIRSSQPALYLPLNLIVTLIPNNDEAGSGTAPHPQTTSQASHHGPGPMSMWTLVYIYIYIYTMRVESKQNCMDRHVLLQQIVCSCSSVNRLCFQFIQNCPQKEKLMKLFQG